MPEELHEMHEHAEHAHHDPSLAPATLTMAILAVLVAIASLLGHRSHTEEILLQNQATDEWGFFQAKNIRLHIDEAVAASIGIVETKDAEAATKVKEIKPRLPSCKTKSRSPVRKPTASIWARFSSRSA